MIVRGTKKDDPWAYVSKAWRDRVWNYKNARSFCSEHEAMRRASLNGGVYCWRSRRTP